MPQKNVIPLEPGQYYHIFNRGARKQKIFFNQENYAYFLRLFNKHIQPFAHTFAYCLLGNHFHFLIQIKFNEELPISYQDGQKSLSLPFSHWFNAYTQAINKQMGQTGSFFDRPFKRVLVSTEEQFIRNIYYIHANPQKHKIVKDFRQYPYGSYPILIQDAPSSFLENQRVWDWFGNRERFIAYHDEWHEYLSEMDLEP